MTLTAPSSTSSAVDSAVFGNDVAAADWISTADHRRVGQLHLGFVLAMAAAAAVVGFVVHGSLGDLFTLSASGRSSLDALFAAHENAWSVLVGLPLWIAIGSLVVPGQIGAGRMAFPRLQSLSLWGWVFGAATFVSASLVENGPSTFTVTSSAAATASGPANKATDLLLASLILVTLATLAGALNLVATVVTERRPGLTFGALRPLTWSIFVTSALLLITLPAFIAGLFLVYLDQHFGGTLFTAEGSQHVWVHLVWMWGRPEAFLIGIPAAGVVADVIVARTGRPLLGGSVANWLILAAAALSLGVWTGGDAIASAVVVPTSRIVTGLVLIPLGLLLLVVIGSVRGGLRPNVSLLFALGVILALATGAVLVAVAGAKDVVGGNSAFFGFGLTNLVVFGVGIIGAAGALVEHAPDIYGRPLIPAGAGLAGLALIAGVLLSGVGPAVAAFSDSTDTLQNMNVVAAAGKALVAAGAVLLIVSIVGSALRRPSASEGAA